MGMCHDPGEGSSPLARGLLRRQPEVHRHEGIIPARAGFTLFLRLAVFVTWDHPRSRGVYASQFHTVNRQEGSSPLARGLRIIPDAIHDLDGIIPARAGFTNHSSSSHSISTDHPRSRGVYAWGRFADSVGTGSSPLARGLPGGCVTHVRGFRIIPARAGFTVLRRPRPHRLRDHPRSRGVYHWRYAIVTPGTGSSPLARGLRPRAVRRCHGRGIIPARAGFTEWLDSRVSGFADHPRSRGVYRWVWAWGQPLGGSSPLARGLPTCTQPDPPHERIIPARAGFTPLGILCMEIRLDHPRSRGVYTAG